MKRSCNFQVTSEGKSNLLANRILIFKYRTRSVQVFLLFVARLHGSWNFRVGGIREIRSKDFNRFLISHFCVLIEQFTRGWNFVSNGTLEKNKIQFEIQVILYEHNFKVYLNRYEVIFLHEFIELLKDTGIVNKIGTMCLTRF